MLTHTSVPRGGGVHVPDPQVTAGFPNTIDNQTWVREGDSSPSAELSSLVCLRGRLSRVPEASPPPPPGASVGYAAPPVFRIARLRWLVGYFLTNRP